MARGCGKTIATPSRSSVFQVISPGTHIPCAAQTRAVPEAHCSG